ncbi:MAG: DUF4838 domain-containing protein [Kiritimatiellia bacterium]
MPDNAAIPVTISSGGSTEYQVVMASDATPVDKYAARELALYLKQMTGADFPVVTSGAMDSSKPSIFVGMSKPAQERLGGKPLDELANQEHVARSAGTNIFLYGQGVHGSLYAAMEFLESQLGWRWYSVFELPVLPGQETVTLQPFNRKSGFSFAYRKVGVRRGMDFYYQQGMNMGFDGRVYSLIQRGATNVPKSFVSEINDVFDGCHTLFNYIPPGPVAQGAESRPWLVKSNYFETNPEYFSQWENGKRVKDRQLCFSNPGLRKELTANITKTIEQAGEPCILALSAMDTPGSFCYCPACKALEEKYKSPGGPLYDYLIELCANLHEKHPGALIKTLAYRSAQTQKPPVLPEGKKLPENLVIDFAPIEDNYFADWTHPDKQIQETLSDLMAWGKITTHLSAWLYPNPWGSGIVMPVGNVERLINNMRLMHKAGVEAVFTDHCSYNHRGGWSEIQAYLFYKLCRDVNCDTGAIIREFTDNFYGPAADLMRKYMRELEQCRKDMKELPPGVNYRSGNTDERTFPYLTVTNIHRWQGYFDLMEEKLKKRPNRELANVRYARRALDLATMWKWLDSKKAYPDYYIDHKLYVARINAVNEIKAIPSPDWEQKSINRQASKGPGPGDFTTLIEAGGEAKPLPAEFAGMDQAKIKQFLPKYPNRRAGRTVILDKEAAFGYAVPVADPDLPFTFGFYQGDTRTHGAKRTVELKEITPGKYNLYKLGEITVTPDCLVWFARSWATNLGLGERLYEPGADNIWEAYASVKFMGPTYGGDAGEALLPRAERIPYGGKPEDLVLVDRIVFVPKSADQFKKP